MRFPYIRKVSRQINLEEGKLVGTAAIQRYINDELRFFVFYKLQRYKEVPLDVQGPPLGTYRGMDNIVKIGQLHECSAETGEHPRARAVITALLSRPVQDALTRIKAASFIRVSTGVYRHMEKLYRAASANEKEELLDGFLITLRKHWREQAELAKKFIEGKIDSLRDFPVQLKMLPKKS